MSVGREIQRSTGQLHNRTQFKVADSMSGERDTESTLVISTHATRVHKKLAVALRIEIKNSRTVARVLRPV